MFCLVEAEPSEFCSKLVEMCCGLVFGGGYGHKIINAVKQSAASPVSSWHEAVAQHKLKDRLISV